MEQNRDIAQMLELISNPAFCVQDGIITAVNPEAERLQIAVQQQVAELLFTGQQEYPAFQDGCLHLTLKAAGISYGASVTRMNGFDVFVLEQDAEHAELQAMALAAQELRAPLSNIMTVAEDLFPLCAANDSTADELTAQINRGLYQLQRIVCNMSDAYRYRMGDTPILEIRDMGALWDELFVQSAQYLCQTGVALHFTGLAEKIFSLADGDKLERAVYNILSNALKYTPKGGTIEAAVTRKGNMLYLTVQSSSSDIGNELRGNLFNRFQRQPGIEDTRHGIGLGMVLIHSVAAMHGGTVLLEQPAGSGLRLTMSMAIQQNTDAYVRSNALRIDYAGERDHALIELSESLPASLYAKEKNG